VNDLNSAVNFMRSRGLNHRQFKAFLDEIESDYRGIMYTALELA